MTYSIDTMDIDELAKELNAFAKRGLPFATKHTINQAAWETRKEMQDNISSKMIERNKWTRGSVQVRLARTLDIDNQSSSAGSTEAYMVTQEDGGTETAKGKHGVSIPTGYSAGQEGQVPRTKLPRRANRMKNIKINRFRARGKNPRQRVIVAVNMAIKNNSRLLFLETSKAKVRTGIYRVFGGNYTGRGWPGDARLKMVQDLSHKSMHIPSTPTLGPAVNTAVKNMSNNYRKALIFQLKRAGVRF